MKNAIWAAIVLCGCGGGLPTGGACGSHGNANDCVADSRCAVAGCPDCEGGTGFSVCYDKSKGPPDLACPAIACASLCSSITDEQSCTARPDCHSVYEPMNICGCAAAGCCTFFSSCAAGQPYCKSDQLMCRAAEPDCAGPYVVAYAGSCYEGCVLATACP